MSKLIYMLLVGMLLSCGKDDPPQETATSCEMKSDLLGSWSRTTANDVMAINSNCTYTGSLCSSNGVITPVKNSDGSVSNYILITVKANNGSDSCGTAPRTTSCAYQITGNQLTIACGSAGTSIYERI